jgi:uncharacterized membrane protein YGL010W
LDEVARMKSLSQQLTQYARYHRDRRNIATHFIGIPAIVVGVDAVLARPTALLAAGATVAAALFYFALDRRFGLAMAVYLAASLWLGERVALLPTAAWIVASAVLFAGGWVFQFVGHAFEGKKPAFVDDLVGLLIGPLFVVAEAAFGVGLCHDLQVEIERVAGPTYIRKADVAQGVARPSV